MHAVYTTAVDLSITYAILNKVLLEEIRRNSELLQSFRRGVRSMHILADHQVEGMVAYRDASEIPAFVVMDFVEGPSLQEAVEAKLLDEWSLTIRIGADLTRIVRNAHQLPERVLHRDLRPSNVMLKGFYTEPDDWRVMVLDFDLSWHRGATEQSVTHGSTLFGYLAPEQIQATPGASTRHAAVDSFGLGMTLFFMVSRRHPMQAEHRHAAWSAIIRDACRNRRCPQWQSTPERFARLILKTTRDRQAERWDLAQVETELRRLLGAVLNPETVDSADLLAEEVATRTDVMSKYTWDDDTSTAAVETPTGIDATLRGDAVNHRLVVSFDWRSRGLHYYKKIGKWIKPAAQNCSAILSRAGWSISGCDVDFGGITICASIDTELVTRRITELAASLDRAMGPLRID